MASLSGSGFRVATWNLQGRTSGAAARLGSLLADHGGADLVLLQEASQAGLPGFCEAAGLDWAVHVRDEFYDLLAVRGRASGPRSVAIAGTGEQLRGPTAFPGVPLPEKVQAGWLDIGQQRTTAVTYHAPTGVTHKEKKAEQAVKIATWLNQIEGPAILAGDFNTPAVDPPGISSLETGYHTGNSELHGAPGEDTLVGATPLHELRDALRTYLDAHPDEMEEIRLDRPNGPLAISHRTGTDHQHPVRYDAIWHSPEFSVQAIDYYFDESVAAGTDHALVIAEFALKE